jgi:serine/threonine protein kinase
MTAWKLGAHDFKGNERFEVRRRIGEGGMGIVYEAFDRERQTEVALKILLRVSPGAIYRIKKEFRALADVNHPNLVTLFELVSSGEHWFFTMELVEGVSFLQYVRPGLVSEAKTVDETQPTVGDAFLMTRTMPDAEGWPKPDAAADLLSKVAMGESEASELPAIDTDRLRHALKELAEGLVALHDAGKLHRDIKPSNVVVTPRGRIVLLDFGLATDVDEDSLAQSALGSVVGTIGYMAPEQASGGHVTPASDWYAVGSMLYQALTGRLPFTGSLYQVVFDKQGKDPVHVHQLDTSAPGDLADLAMRLLSRDPNARPTGREILEKLGGLPPALATPALAFALPELSPQFVGREEHLAHLEDAFSASADASVIVHVRGSSGMGKTALVRHFLEALEAAGRASVFAGRCYERELVPYKALDNLVDGMSRHLRRTGHDEVASILPDGIEALARLFPVLNRVDAIHHRSAQTKATPDPVQVRSKAFTAFRELLRNLGRKRPVVLCLDDLQWGDADSASLIEEVIRQPEAPPLMLIAVYRSEDRDTSELLRVLRMPHDHPRTEVRDLLVGPLDPAAAKALARSIIGRLESSRLDRSEERLLEIVPRDVDLLDRAEEIVRESQGSPLFIYELAVHAQQTDSAEMRPVAPQEEADTSQSIKLEEMLRYRLNHLPAAARELLEIVAVAGRPLRVDVANMAAGIDPKDRSGAALLSSNHLARTRSANGVDEIESYHDRIRSAVVHTIEPSLARHRRRALAHALVNDTNASPEELVLALREAGEHDRAAEAASLAAERSLDATAFYQAASLYGLALDLSSDSEGRWDLRAKWADALAQAGRGEEAGESYLSASARAPKERRIDLLRRAAEQFLRFGMTGRGIEILRDVLTLIGMEYPKTSEEAYQAVRLIRSRLLLRGLSYRERDPKEIPTGILERADVCWSAGVGLTMVDVLRSSIFASAFLHHALDAGDPHRIARALAMELALLTGQGDKSPNRTKRVLSTLGELANRIDDPYIAGFAALGECFAAWHSGRWADTAIHGQKAESLLRERCAGVDWEIDTAATFRLWAESYRGSFTGMRELLDQRLRDARTRKNLYAASVLTMSANATVIWLADNDVATARDRLEEARGASAQAGFHLQHFWELSSRVLFDLYTGDGMRAWKRISRHWERLDESMFTRVQVIRAEARFLRARCALAAAKHDPSPTPYLEAARQDASALEGEGVPYSIGFGQIIRARVVHLMGLLSEASAHYERAARTFAEADMTVHALAAQRRRAKLVPHDGRAIIMEVDKRMRERGVANPEAMASLLVP